MDKKILVIDANEKTRHQNSRTLEESGYTVSTATNAPEAFWHIDTDRPDLILLDIEMADMSSFDICRIIKEAENSHLLPIILISRQDYQNDVLIGLDIGADDYIIAPYNTRELLSRIKNAIRRVEHLLASSSITRLPGSAETYRKISSMLIKNNDFSVIYIDIDNLRHFNAKYGYIKGDIIIKHLAEIIIAQTKSYGNEHDFVGHLGKDDFVIITTPECSGEICEAAIQHFDEKTKNLYPDEDIQNGYFTLLTRQGNHERIPLTTISAAIVPCTPSRFSNVIQISETAGSLKFKLKSLPGSNYLTDKRK